MFTNTIIYISIIFSSIFSDCIVFMAKHDFLATEYYNESLLDKMEQYVYSEKFWQKVRERIPDAEEGMAAMYEALPKNKFNRLDIPVTNYAMSRYFLHQHSWSILRLSRNGFDDSSSPMELLHQLLAPLNSTLPKFSDINVDIYGFLLRDMASLAAIIEVSIGWEVYSLLRLAYAVAGRNTSDLLTPVEMYTIVERCIITTFASSYMEGVDSEASVRRLSNSSWAFRRLDDRTFIRERLTVLELLVTD